MVAQPEWVTYRCACGFQLQRVPRDVIDDLPRCLGCGRSLRPTLVRTRALASVRDLR